MRQSGYTAALRSDELLTIVFTIGSYHPMRTRGDMLSFAIAFALRGAGKLVRGFREELTEEKRYRVANDVVHH